MPSEAELVALLRSADTAWSTAQGRIRHWRNHTLVSRAFDEHFDRLSADGHSVWSLAFTPVGEPADDPILETVQAIAVDRPRRRRRAELLSWYGEERRPDVIVIDGDTFWARTGSELLTNDGDRSHSHGGTEFCALLQPSAVLDRFSLSMDGGEQDINGRRCVSVAATRRRDDAGMEGSGLDPFGMIAGGDYFLLSVDLDVGVLIRVVKVVSGQSAEISEFTELSLDCVLPESLFAPLADQNPPPETP